MPDALLKVNKVSVDLVNTDFIYLYLFTLYLLSQR